MIRKLTGTVASTHEHAVVLDVNGIGYLVATPTGNAFREGQELSLHTHLAVRETALDLYGFEDVTTLELFELLLTIPKIGPKSALEILTKADPSTIHTAVTQNDAGYLTKVSGIGKKTAEKIVSELSDKLAFMPSDTATPGTQSVPALVDAIDALVALGYPYADARNAVQNLPASVTTSNEAVREALKVLGSS